MVGSDGLPLERRVTAVGMACGPAAMERFTSRQRIRVVPPTNAVSQPEERFWGHVFSGCL